MKIYLDDARNTPDGWHRVYWPDELIHLLKTTTVEEISLDHDLGDDNRGTGYDVILWIEQQVATNNFVPPAIHIHSSNSAGVTRMKAGRDSIYRYHKRNLNIQE